uniref:SKP1 component dimerisation domain-containing protein n=1 Tax=Acrobeloides nanus TaxID=290746 RepID=A0A914DIH7_9BILA
MKLVMNGSEIEVPEDFTKLSGFLFDYVKDYIGSISDPEEAKKKMEESIPISDDRFSILHVQTIRKFLELLKENEPEDYENSKEIIEKNLKKEKIEELPEWAFGFFESIEKDTLFTTMNCANYLLIKSFFMYSTKYVADKTVGMDVREMRNFLNEDFDFSNEDIEAFKAEESWKLLMIENGLIPAEEGDSSSDE